MIDYNGKKQTLCILMHLKQTLHNRQLHETKLQYEGRVLMFNHIPYISIYVDLWCVDCDVYLIFYMLNLIMSVLSYLKGN